MNGAEPAAKIRDLKNVIFGVAFFICVCTFVCVYISVCVCRVHGTCLRKIEGEKENQSEIVSLFKGWTQIRVQKISENNIRKIRYYLL